MKRHQFRHDELTLSYLNEGGEGQVVIALHAHWMEGLTFAALAEALAPECRVIAMDQRGHGHSDHALTYTRADYVNDVEALFQHLGLDEAIILGNSLGGVNAYQFAARYPHRVLALVIEDIGVEVSTDVSFILSWGGTFPSREALADRIGQRLAPYLEDSFRHTTDGWRLAFNPRELVISQSFLNGNHWDDWLSTHCPALIIRGNDSKLTDPVQMEEMAIRRPNTSLQTLKGGHVLHIDNPIGFIEAVPLFLSNIVQLALDSHSIEASEWKRKP